MDVLRGGSTRTWYEVFNADGSLRVDRLGSTVGTASDQMILYRSGEWAHPFEFPTTVSGRDAETVVSSNPMASSANNEHDSTCRTLVMDDTISASATFTARKTSVGSGTGL